MTPTQLRQLLDDAFDESELRDLCFNLAIDYENLPGEGQGAKARELVAWAVRHGRMGEVETACRRLRPGLFVPAVKPIWESKTFWVNAVLVLVAVINIWLRIVTREGVRFRR